MDKKERHSPSHVPKAWRASAVIENECILLLEVNTHDLSCARRKTEASGGDVQVPIRSKGHSSRQVQARDDGL
jgi:hypothetical protein